MNAEHADPIVRTVFSEGGVLHRCQPAEFMKQHRVTCGLVVPASVGDGLGAQIETQCLVRAPGSSNLDVQVRFLHLATRHPEVLEWDEASERVVALQVGLADGCVSPIRESFRWPGFQTAQRTQETLRGDVELLVESVGIDPEVFKVTVVVANTTGAPCTGLDRASVLRHSLVSPQILVEAPGGRFVPLTDSADAEAAPGLSGRL
jgi:hypothetical protein